MKQKLLLGFDIGSSSIKASIIDSETGEVISSGVSPEREMKIDSPKMGWAEQHPETWWSHVVTATKKMLASGQIDKNEIAAIGISYQMHGLVMVNKKYEVIHPSIIWCDSRAVEIGEKAFNDLGSGYCLNNCLNSPGNFTASKLKWVKENRPDLYSQVYKIMLPGDFIALKMTGEIFTTVSGLSEGIFWDFSEKNISDKLMQYYGFDKAVLPEIVPTFGEQGKLNSKAAEELGLREGIPVAYRAGDQPNNAFSLNVLEPGEIASTAGTSGVIYGITDKNIFDAEGRVNTFAHVNYTDEHPNKGVLLCINGTGIQYSWIKQNIMDNKFSYQELNDFAASVKIGAEGLICYPFGNGAERSLKSKDIKGHFAGINFNIHGKGHLVRSAQEGIAFSFRYGLEVMKSIGMQFNVIKAGNSNLFQSGIFREAFVNTCDINLKIFNTDGAQGAARGAGIGINLYPSAREAFAGLKILNEINPETKLVDEYNLAYDGWKNHLKFLLKE